MSSKDIGFNDKLVHYAIYETSPDGKNTMYRQFILLSSGAIIEIFDQYIDLIGERNKELQSILSKETGYKL